MVALVLSAFLVAYLLAPNALFRLILGQFVPVKVVQGNRTEEITRAVVTLLFLYLVSLPAIWYLPGFKAWPWPFLETPSLRASDYSVVAGSLYSDAFFNQQHDFWSPFWRCARRQAHFLFWYYVFTALWAFTVGFASKYYGKLKRFKIYSFIADVYLFPHVSQWYALLTGFTFAENTTVKADVLMSDDTLYKGEIADYFIAGDGTLAGIFLKAPKRFDRPRYLAERDQWGTTRSATQYWRPIPSAKLYLVGSHIVNLNLNYEPIDVSRDVLERYLTEGLSRTGLQGITITVQPRSIPPRRSWFPLKKG